MSNFVILIIKFYQYLLSPLLGNNCRYNKNCSTYFIEAVKTHETLKGTFFGLKRILSCHSIKILGGGSGLEFVPKKKIKKESLNGK